MHRLFAAMQDDRLVQLGCKAKLLCEQIPLPGLLPGIVNPVVIKSDLANGNDFGMRRKRADVLQRIRSELSAVGRMNPDSGKDRGILRRDLKAVLTGFNADAG